MFVALEHMQVNFVTASRTTRLMKFRKNVISFTQDTPAFAHRVGLLCRYDPGDWVNTRRGPGMALGTPGKHAFSATEQGIRLLAQDEQGYLVYSATVESVDLAGKLRLKYDHDLGEGEVEISHVQPRVRMPWHPKFLKGVCTLMLRRNLGRGRVLEGLELRWGLVPDILQALAQLGRWRLDGGADEPMHKWYDPRAFDLPSRAEIMSTRAVMSDGAALPDARTGEELLASGLDVRFFGAEGATRRLPTPPAPRTPTLKSMRPSSFAGWSVPSSCLAARRRAGGSA